MGIVVIALVTVTIIFGCIWLLAKMFTGNNDSAQSAVKASLKVALKLFYWAFSVLGLIFVVLLMTIPVGEPGPRLIAGLFWFVVYVVLEIVLWFAVAAIESLLS